MHLAPLVALPPYITATRIRKRCAMRCKRMRSIYQKYSRGDILTTPRGIVVTLSIAMLFNHGDIVMRILSKLQLKELVLYSPQHIARLEKAGKFPKRVKLGPNRVGWIEDEVLDWLQLRLDEREST
ncbi:helix-turn-helix transcriptional regulator [Roseovarius indicus]|uniref:helix-turn-helix transcriptional regulator n=2 Tax=Roseovarius indicus TaxID=540747 RepID=UPI003517C7CC